MEHVDVYSILTGIELDDLEYYFEGEWRTLAACLGLVTKGFFLSRGEDQKGLEDKCGKCMARDDCACYAVLANEAYGYWGGLSERRRKVIRKRLATTHPNLVKVGRELRNNNKNLPTAPNTRKKKPVVGEDEEEFVPTGQLARALLPKAMELLKKLRGLGGTCLGTDMAELLNVSIEAFDQRIDFARQNGWVKVEGQKIVLTSKGAGQLQPERRNTQDLQYHSEQPVQITTNTPPSRTQTEGASAMSKAKPGELNQLGIEILQALTQTGELHEDPENGTATQQLCDQSSLEAGPPLSNTMAKLYERGLVDRTVNGRRTTYLTITKKGSKALAAIGTEVPSSNGSKPAASNNPAPGATLSATTVPETYMNLGETVQQMLGDYQASADANAALHQQVQQLEAEKAELVQQATEAEENQRAAEAKLADAEAELERVRPLAERYEQMQLLLQPAP